MSVPLWNLSSGSIVHLSGFSSIINSAFALDREVSHTQCRNQLGQCAIACDLAEAALGFEHAGGSPSEDHRATLPAFHPARDLTHSTEQVLDQIGRLEHPLKALRQIQSHYGERFVESLAQRTRGTRIF